MRYQIETIAKIRDEYRSNEFENIKNGIEINGLMNAIDYCGKREVRLNYICSKLCYSIILTVP